MTTTTETTGTTTIPITATWAGMHTRRPCGLCSGTTDKEDVLYTFPDPDDGSESFACHTCAHAGTDRLRAQALDEADEMEAHAARLLALAPRYLDVMGAAEYVTVELSGVPAMLAGTGPQGGGDGDATYWDAVEETHRIIWAALDPFPISRVAGCRTWPTVDELFGAMPAADADRLRRAGGIGRDRVVIS